MANAIIALMESDDCGNKEFAMEQIHALCLFYEDNKPEEEDK